MRVELRIVLLVFIGLGEYWSRIEATEGEG